MRVRLPREQASTMLGSARATGRVLTMTPMQKALKLLSYWMFFCTFAMLVFGMVLFTFVNNTVAVIMAALAAACIAFDVMLGVLGRGAAADAGKALEMRNVILTALVFNAVAIAWFVLWGGMVVPVVANAVSVFVFAAVAHLVNEQTKRD